MKKDQKNRMKPLFSDNKIFAGSGFYRKLFFAIIYQLVGDANE
jgi:hypothetical protein